MRRRLASVALATACTHAPPPKPAAPVVCPAELAIRTQDDVTTWATCTTAHSLTIHTVSMLDLRPLALAEVTGDVQVGSTTALEAVSLPNLRVIGGALRVTDAGGVRGIYLPKLERAGEIELARDDELETLSLPALRTVAGAFRITDAHVLGFVAAPLAQVGGQVQLTGTPALSVVEAPALPAVSP